MYDTEEEAKVSEVDVQLVEDQHTGLAFNVGFRPELMTYDAIKRAGGRPEGLLPVGRSENDIEGKHHLCHELELCRGNRGNVGPRL